LINYCNEKLQFHFNSHIFVMEQEAYRLEGIDIDYVQFQDNSPTLAVIEVKATGILSMIDEEINIPKGSDLSLLNKILSSHEKSGCITRAKPAARSKGGQISQAPSCLSSFAIRHYAGDVPYDVTGFLEKNKDALSADLMYVGKTSSVPFVAEMFRDFETTHTAVPPSSKKMFSKRATSQPKGPTIAFQFRKQLADLITTLNSTSLFFVRCMKSNSEKKGGIFESNLMLKQLQYSGLLEVCRIRQEGFPYRIDFQGFYCMYRKLNFSSTTGPLLAKDLETKGLYGPNDYRIGKNKIFLKYATGQKLEQLRGDSINDAANTCQAMAKVFLAKRRLKVLLRSCHFLKTAIQAKDKSVLEAVVELMRKHIPNEGLHLPVVREAKIALVRVREEEPVIEMLDDALSNKDLSAMELALAQARAMTPQLASPLVLECENAIKDYLRERMDEMKGSFEAMSTAKPPGERSNNSPPAPPPPPPLAPQPQTAVYSSSSKTSRSSPLSKAKKPPTPATNNVPFASKPASVKTSSGETFKSKPQPQPQPTTMQVPFANNLTPVKTSQYVVHEKEGGIEEVRERVWGSPSAIRAAQGKKARPVTVSTHAAKEKASHMASVRECDHSSSGSEPAPQAASSSEGKSQTPAGSADASGDDTSRHSESDQIVKPAEDFKSKRRSVLKRQLSSEQMGIAAEIHHMIEVLHDLCMSEVGINASDTKPLEVMLKKLSARDCTVSKEVADMMMAEQELIRAKKQLLLQVAVDKVNQRTPLWKLKNLAHQSRQIGMENYQGEFMYVIRLYLFYCIFLMFVFFFSGCRNLANIIACS
jgi:hypothetical protein